MSIPHFQIVHFHFTVPMKAISFLEVQSAATLYDMELARTEFQLAYKQHIKERLLELETALSADGQLMVFFSKSFLDLLNETDSDAIEQIRQLVQKERIVLVGSCAYSSFSYLCHPLLFQEEVKLHQQSLKYYFNKQAKYFINTACLYDNQLAELLQTFQYQTVIATANSWHLAGRQASQLFRSAGEEAIQLILANGDSTAQQTISLVNGYGSAYGEEPLQVLTGAELHDLYYKSSEEKHVYAVSLPISSPEWQYNIPQYMANPLQKALIQEGRRLMESKGHQLTEEDQVSMMCLLQPDHLLKMHQSSQSESYQYFISSMNILTAIGLRNA